MYNIPPLGGFTSKLAGAYLLPPTRKLKKKKVQKPEQELDTAEKVASIVSQIVFEKQAELANRIHSGNLGGGWNLFDHSVSSK
jgi:hypothetical protein